MIGHGNLYISSYFKVSVSKKKRDHAGYRISAMSLGKRKKKENAVNGLATA